jgi:hypothetical protein
MDHSIEIVEKYTNRANRMDLLINTIKQGNFNPTQEDDYVFFWGGFI